MLPERYARIYRSDTALFLLDCSTFRDAGSAGWVRQPVASVVECLRLRMVDEAVVGCVE